MVLQGKRENTVHTLRGGNIATVKKFVDLVYELMLVISAIIDHLVNSSVMPFVHIFEKIFDGSDGRGDFNVNVTVEFRTEVTVERHYIEIGKLVTASDNSETIAASLIQWKSIFIEGCLFSVLSWVPLRHFPFCIQEELGLIVPHGPCNIKETIVS